MPPVFNIESSERNGRLTLRVSGVIDEHAELDSLSEITSDVEVNLKDVRRINSFGVRSWMDAVRQIPNSVELIFVEAPPPVVDQCNMVRGFLGHGKLKSFFAPMVCEECDEQANVLFETQRCRELGGKLPSTPCKSCGRDMEVDDLEEQYLLFVRQADS